MTWSKHDSFGSDDCTSKWFIPAGWILTQLQFYRAQSNGTTISLCYSSGATYSTSETYEHRLRFDVGTTTLCGDDYYRTRALGMMWVNPDWVGGYFWSGLPGVHYPPV